MEITEKLENLIIDQVKYNVFYLVKNFDEHNRQISPKQGLIIINAIIENTLKCLENDMFRKSHENYIMSNLFKRIPDDIMNIHEDIKICLNTIQKRR